MRAVLGNSLAQPPERVVSSSYGQIGVLTRNQNVSAGLAVNTARRLGLSTPQERNHGVSSPPGTAPPLHQGDVNCDHSEAPTRTRETESQSPSATSVHIDWKTHPSLVGVERGQTTLENSDGFSWDSRYLYPKTHPFGSRVRAQDRPMHLSVRGLEQERVRTAASCRAAEPWEQPRGSPPAGSGSASCTQCTALPATRHNLRAPSFPGAGDPS